MRAEGEGRGEKAERGLASETSDTFYVDAPPLRQRGYPDGGASVAFAALSDFAG